MKLKNGFTLIEVLIVLIILAVMATLTAQTIQRSAAVKLKIQHNIDQTSAIRNALSVMERDISLSFNYRDPNREVQDAIKKEKLAQDPNAAQEEVRPPPPKLTQFTGEAQRLMFTSLGGVRVMPDAQESEQMEVSYVLRGCKSFFTPDKTMQCLFRKTSPIIDEKLDDGGIETAILENVTFFGLRYFGTNKEEDWVQTWKTGEGADDNTRDQFPLAVEITLETEEDGKKVKMLTVAELRFPNNKKKEETNALSTTR